jgi:hypothetical protein
MKIEIVNKTGLTEHEVFELLANETGGQEA